MIENVLSLIAEMRANLDRFPNTNTSVHGTGYTYASLRNAINELLDKVSAFIDAGLFGVLPSEGQVGILNAVDTVKFCMTQQDYPAMISNMENIYKAFPQLKHHIRFASQINDLHTIYSKIREDFDSQGRQIKRLFAASKERDEGLEQLKAEHKAQLTEHSEEHNETRKKANALIEEVKAALEPATVAGLSAAFTERYNANRKWWKVVSNFLWVVAAGAAIGGALCVIYPLLSEKGIKLGDHIAKFTIMLPAAGVAWFCAARYARYSNITEDYGYKSVLAKSMIAFLDQFQGQSRERELYLNTVLHQLFQDPLRKRHDMEHPATSFLRRNKRPENDDESDK